ncbi:MAG: hypothetical protein R8P61_35225 [Bacteroidia bacterium]|nr:hypothetical protein [Bacteroidia bacterium]
MEWYIPITILPGIGMIIISTVNQMLSLSNEVGTLLNEDCSSFQHFIADKKIRQLGLLTKAMTLLYIAAASFVLSGILGVASPAMENLDLPSIILVFASAMVLAAICLLIVYAFRTVSIRKLQFEQISKIVKEKDRQK